MGQNGVYSPPIEMTRTGNDLQRSGRRVQICLAAVAILAALSTALPTAAAQRAKAKPAAAKTKPLPSNILPEHKPPAPVEHAAAPPTETAAATPAAAHAQILPARKPPAPPPRPQSEIAEDTPAPLQAVTVTALASPLSAREKQALSEAVKSAAKRNWARARADIATARNPLLSKIIEWAYLREPGEHASFATRTAFVAANPKWPATETIRRRAEEAIDGADSLSMLNDWFSVHPPLTTPGKIGYARALKGMGNTEKSTALAREAWTTGYLNREDERSFLQEFGGVLTPADHWARADYLLYDEQTTAASRLMPLLDAGHQAIVKARVALITSQKNMDALIAQVPGELQNDPGLLYDRIKWRRERNNDLGARQLVPAFEVGGARADLWWRERHTLARDALADGNVTEAYAIAKHHGSSDPTSVSEAEWLAGWIALRFLKDGETALQHFEKAYDVGPSPAALARGAYWMGRTTESLKRPDLAIDWYQRASTYITTYYGQMALARLHGEDLPQEVLPTDPAPTDAERATFNTSELTQCLRALMDVDAKTYQRLFAQALSDDTATAAERQLTAELLSQLKRVDLGVVVARQAARDKITLVQYGYPAPGWTYPAAPEKALILAITRQESNFDVGAQSGVGARGLMQLMPPTARAVARANKLAYAEKRLTSDASYNVRLGSGYLKSLLEDFDGSYILAAAAYNAGPGRARAWIRQFGDPRDPGVDAVDWVEQIPFNETRSYVQRIMENLMIYRAVLNGTAHVPRNLETELARHG